MFGSARKSDAIRVLAALLLAPILLFAAIPVSGSASIPTCACCSVDKAACSARACCRAEQPDQAPAAPAPASRRAATDWQILATFATLFHAPRPTAHDFSAKVSLLSLQARAVPIFQRDCSYLI